MTTRQCNSTQERFGYRLGELWRGYRRGERRLAGHLTTRVGLPPVAALALIWIVRLAVLGAALYVASGLAVVLLVVLCAAVAAGKGRSEPEPEEEWQWRTGWYGYGLYHGETPISTSDQDDD